MQEASNRQISNVGHALPDIRLSAAADYKINKLLPGATTPEADYYY